MHHQHAHGGSHSHEHDGHTHAAPEGSGDEQSNWLERFKSLFGHHHHDHGHTHDSLGLYNITERGIWAVEWSFVAIDAIRFDSGWHSGIHRKRGNFW